MDPAERIPGLRKGLVSPWNLLFRDLKQSEAKFRSIFETTGVAIAYCHMDGRVLDANDDYLRLIGFTREEIEAGEARWDLVTPPEWKQTDEAALEQLRLNSVCPPLEKEYVRRDGTRVPVLLGASLVTGHPEQVVAIGIDITERKRAEEALRTAKERALWLARFPDENPSPIIRVSEDGKVLYCNPSAQELPGWTSAIGQPLDSRLQPLVNRAMAEGEEQQEDVQIGSLVYSVWVVPFSEESYANVYGRDITERKRAEEALRKAHDDLEKRVQERTSLLDDLVQRLQTEILHRKRLEETLRESEKQVRLFATQCLTAQETERKRIAAELHDSTAASLAAIKFRIEEIGEDLRKGLAVTESLQDLSSKVAQSLEEVRRIMTDLRPSVLDDLGILPALNWFCREFHKTYSHIFVEKQIGAEEHEVPDSLKTPIFRIAQEAMNNIAKHSKASLVNLFLRKEGERILLSVRDNGQGFDPEIVKKGMGLSNIRERAELSGGTSELQTGIGKGTTIRVSWPIQMRGEV